MTEELKPCPKCGSNDVTHQLIETYSLDSSYYIIGCNSCECNIPAMDARLTERDIKSWNTRTTDAEIMALRQEAEKAIDDNNFLSSKLNYAIIMAETAEAEVARFREIMKSVENRLSNIVPVNNQEDESDDVYWTFACVITRANGARDELKNALANHSVEVSS